VWKNDFNSKLLMKNNLAVCVQTLVRCIFFTRFFLLNLLITFKNVGSNGKMEHFHSV
jgi:hypothetical protein